jgi:hypothetical protein
VGRSSCRRKLIKTSRRNAAQQRVLQYGPRRLIGRREQRKFRVPLACRGQREVAIGDRTRNLGKCVGAMVDNGILRAVKWNFDLPPDAARSFVEDMRAYHAEESGAKREEIAARQA